MKENGVRRSQKALLLPIPISQLCSSQLLRDEKWKSASNSRKGIGLKNQVLDLPNRLDSICVSEGLVLHSTASSDFWED